MNRLVYVCHPWGNDPVANDMRVTPVCEAIQARGDIPIFAPFVFPWLDDAHPDERAMGMEMGLHLLRLCRVVEIHGARPGELTAGMETEIEHAGEIGVPVHWMTEGA